MRNCLQGGRLREEFSVKGIIDYDGNQCGVFVRTVSNIDE
jgi:hypothetical protein